MQYKCDKCNDSGSLNKFGPYYDCTSCDAAEQRVALEKWCSETQQRGPSFDDCWAIHQRALAMAPKQEAPSRKLDDMELNHAFDYVTKPWAYVRNEDISRSRAYFKAGYKYAFESAPHSQMSSVDLAAPAAANGALTDGQIDALWNGLHGIDIHNKAASSGVDTAYALRIAFARAILAAAGPDAVLIEAARNVVTCFNDPHTSLAYVQRWVNELAEEIAALSGAKGN